MEQAPIILDDKKFAIYGKRSDGGKGAPKLQFSAFRGNPNISVFNNDPEENDNKPIRAGMDSIAFGTLMGLVDEVIAAPVGEAISKRLVNRKGPPGKTFPDTQVIVGKSEDGVIYLAVHKEGRKTKKFPITSSIYHDVVDSQGNPLPPGEVSRLFAIGFFNQLKHHMNHYLTKTYEPPQPQQGGQRPGGGGGNWGGGGGQQRQSGGGGGNWNNNQGGGSGGGNNSFDDDIPL